jgi:hypothetical protein
LLQRVQPRQQHLQGQFFESTLLVRNRGKVIPVGTDMVMQVLAVGKHVPLRRVQKLIDFDDRFFYCGKTLRCGVHARAIKKNIRIPLLNLDVHIPHEPHNKEYYVTNNHARWRNSVATNDLKSTDNGLDDCAEVDFGH